MTKDKEKSERYHHGDLRTALLEAAEKELIEKGPTGFSLRSTAKRAGVSHAAPAYHFQDVGALLNGLRALGFERLIDSMRIEQGLADKSDAIQTLIAVGVGYVRFAADNPQLFQIMFGAVAGDGSRSDGTDGPFSMFFNAIARLHGADVFKTEDGWRNVTAVWSMVHGYAHLSASGKMTYVTDRPFDEQRAYLQDILGRVIG